MSVAPFASSLTFAKTMCGRCFCGSPICQADGQEMDLKEAISCGISPEDKRSRTEFFLGYYSFFHYRTKWQIHPMHVYFATNVCTGTLIFVLCINVFIWEYVYLLHLHLSQYIGWHDCKRCKDFLKTSPIFICTMYRGNKFITFRLQ